ncbi:membrane protein [Virgisporangium ochraceum]|uniref:Membrane protein n=2 Tax=Virgisporangium ochraceum TaxID=65505 RepID=A0A8J3ZY11_9ACTN|nr:glycosyltransferase 87 family protein [Virgisporangium ochraceum]GIJ69441.1 membrane protein [Virgisporangium ochraceum]
MSTRERVAQRSAEMPARLRQLPAWLPAWARRKGAQQAAIVFGLFLAAWAFDAAFAVRHGFFDLRVYYGALNHWVDGNGALYDYLLPRTKYGFTYPPFAALTMLPMAYLGWHVAIGISMLLTVGAALAVIYWLVEPMARRNGWSPWFVLGVAAALVVAFEPMRETFLFGQVNAILLVLVAADVLFLVRYNRSVAGVGIGLATAIKLTPGIFIIYLIITGRIRAAVVASGTVMAATVFTGAVAPDESRVFWTDALWNTSRVGENSFVSNQSLNGVVHRWDPDQPSNLAWMALVLITLAVWAWRSRAAAKRGDEAMGLALTGIVGVLISPITWVHHLVWVLPAIILLVDRGTVKGLSKRRRNWLLGLAAFTYAVMCSRLVWAFNGGFDTFPGWVGSNAYVWLSLVLLVAVPLAPKPEPVGPPRPRAVDAGVDDLDRELADVTATVRVPSQDDRRLVQA